MKKFVKIFAYVIIFTLFASFIIRCIMVADKSAFSKPLMTEEMIAAYTGDSPEEFIMTVNVAPEMSDSGYFCSYGFYYIPSIGQAQFAVRWNDSAYTYTDVAEGTEFTFYLLNETTGASYPAVVVEAKEKTLYNFRRLEAEGVLFGPDDEIVVVMELRDGYTDRQVLCYAEQPLEPYKLSGKDKTTLLSGTK